MKVSEDGEAKINHLKQNTIANPECQLKKLHLNTKNCSSQCHKFQEQLIVKQNETSTSLTIMKKQKMFFNPELSQSSQPSEAKINHLKQNTIANPECQLKKLHLNTKNCSSQCHKFQEQLIVKQNETSTSLTIMKKQKMFFNPELSQSSQSSEEIFCLYAKNR